MIAGLAVATGGIALVARMLSGPDVRAFNGDIMIVGDASAGLVNLERVMVVIDHAASTNPVVEIQVIAPCVDDVLSRVIVMMSGDAVLHDPITAQAKFQRSQTIPIGDTDYEVYALELADCGNGGAMFLNGAWNRPVAAESGLYSSLVGPSIGGIFGTGQLPLALTEHGWLPLSDTSTSYAYWAQDVRLGATDEIVGSPPALVSTGQPRWESRFGVVPEVLWADRLEADQRNVITFMAGVLAGLGASFAASGAYGLVLGRLDPSSG